MLNGKRMENNFPLYMDEGKIMATFLSLVFIGVFWTGYGLSKSVHKDAPPIKDMNKFSKETIGMSPKEIRQGLKSGRW